MKFLITFILFLTSAFAYALDKTSDTKAPGLVASEKREAYGAIVGELLKGCEGAEKKIAVSVFSYSDGRDSRDGDIVAERVTTELVNAKKFVVIERKAIEKVFEELKFQRSGAIDPKSVKEIGKMVGADWVVVGTLTELPDAQLELNTRLVGVESGEIINAASVPIKKDWLAQYERLLEEQNKAIAKNNKDAKAFYEKGRINLDLKEYDRAVANFSIAITINPLYWEAYLRRAAAYVSLGDRPKAMEDLNRAIEINPEGQSAAGATPFRVRGIVYYQNEEYDDAVNDLTMALEVNPRDGYAYYWRGRAFYMKSKHDSAITDLTKAIELLPEFSEPYSWRGWTYYMRSRHIVNVRHIAKVIPANPGPEWDWAKNMRDAAIESISEADAQAKVAAGYTEAVKDFTKAIGIFPTDRDYNGRGLAYSKIGKRAEAVSDLNMAITLNPDNQARLQGEINDIKRGK